MPSDNEELREHLAPAPEEGRGGPGLQEVLTTISMVSSEIGQLGARFDGLAGDLASVRTDLDAAKSALDGVDTLARQVSGLSTTVAALAAGTPENEDEDEGPPQPWDWDGFSLEEQWENLGVLSAWLNGSLYPWWPQMQIVIPRCWPQHKDMVRSISFLHVLHQQAYAYPDRRTHHEIDWWRALRDVREDIDQLAKTYNCRGKGKGTHRVPADVRDDAPRVADAVRQQLYPRLALLDADALNTSKPQDIRDAAAEESTRLRTKYDVTEEEYRRAVLRWAVKAAETANDTEALSSTRNSAQKRLNVLVDLYGITEEEFQQAWSEQRP